MQIMHPITVGQTPRPARPAFGSADAHTYHATQLNTLLTTLNDLQNGQKTIDSNTLEPFNDYVSSLSHEHRFYALSQQHTRGIH